MKELVIISGKGGTGKTSITAAFSAIANNHLLCDTDVDAADLHLLCAPKIKETFDFMGGSLAQIRQDDCLDCGQCRLICQFEAISEDYVVDPIACEGCGICYNLCPTKAIDFPQQKCGEWFISEAKSGPMIHARLGIAEENSGLLVHLIRQKSMEIANKNKNDIIIIDGPPGIGCPVIAAVTGTTAALLVVEPTVSGVHDMKRAMDLLKHFKLPAMVLINKSDINPQMCQNIINEAERQEIKLVGKIPFNKSFVQAMIEGENVYDADIDKELSHNLNDIWQQVYSFTNNLEKKLSFINPL
ncbi:MAG: ATP-binding protein [Desulfotalea sp.]